MLFRSWEEGQFSTMHNCCYFWMPLCKEQCFSNFLFDQTHPRKEMHLYIPTWDAQMQKTEIKISNEIYPWCIHFYILFDPSHFIKTRSSGLDLPNWFHGPLGITLHGLENTGLGIDFGFVVIISPSPYTSEFPTVVLGAWWPSPPFYVNTLWWGQSLLPGLL